MSVGDRCKYSAEFLRSIGCYTGALPFARGVIEETWKLGTSTMARVNWKNDYQHEVPVVINIANLVAESDPEVRSR